MACDTHHCCTSKGSSWVGNAAACRVCWEAGDSSLQSNICSTYIHALQGVSFFGGSELRQSQVEELANAELLAGSDRMVVLSDVWLDSPEVMDQLQTLFTGLHQHSRMQAWECCTIFNGRGWQHIRCTQGSPAA